MGRRGWQVVAVSLAAGAATACGGVGDGVRDVETTLVDTYLTPLTRAGFHPSVESTCRFADPVDTPWHLDVKIKVAASEKQVADILAEEGVVVVSDREPMIVQQIRDEPGDGWDGVLQADGDSSALLLERSDVTHSGFSDAVGWGEVCPGSPRSPSPSP
ncbi:hypothetical protein COUCH_25765 [Couchioplanes caeruleus]|uniref:hypothetical protein n=1 Tax=Couchioplanes caeruleus TaxID=56438 RepID=UPI0020C148D8|nr:hypothetical protein [Couchioplanes caeruleus]UQU62429.1 hypothetical protein COUCH_25765 [Couchioplanes caeruleus]